jgi:hypothetical protein
MAKTTNTRHCTWTGLPLPTDQPRVRIHPVFRCVTRGWGRAERQRYADLVRQLGTLHHPQLRQLAETIRHERREAEARRLDRRGGHALDVALARDDG